MSEKIAVFAPIPSASDATETATKTGLRDKLRRTNRISGTSELMLEDRCTSNAILEHSLSVIYGQEQGRTSPNRER
jgi:hypothetical protein